MEILDMLERLEAAMLSWRAQAASAGSIVAKQKKVPAKKAVVKQALAKKAIAKNKRSNGKAKNGAAEGEQLTLSVPEEAAPETGARTVGKRQALGRSLLQLRKNSPHRLNENP